MLQSIALDTGLAGCGLRVAGPCSIGALKRCAFSDPFLANINTVRGVHPRCISHSLFAANPDARATRG